MARSWTGIGPEFSIEWGGRSWTLRVDGDLPGLSGPGEIGPYLGLAGLTQVGRSDPLALSGRSLEGFEIRSGRVEATYAPEGWHDLRVRAAWWPSGADGIDLEVQIQASSVGELRLVEAQTITVAIAIPFNDDLWVEPRDPGSAASSYDGREPDLAHLSTGPPGLDDGLWRVCAHFREWGGRTYAEMIRPGDWARRIYRSAGVRGVLRQGLFGHDLEKGVVLRAHLRGIWLPFREDLAVINDEFGRFLAEPPALGT